MTLDYYIFFFYWTGYIYACLVTYHHYKIMIAQVNRVRRGTMRMYVYVSDIFVIQNGSVADRVVSVAPL